jgi:aspartyl-tRNA(Asn)/glutamyl-tRNA(Gln) amidotransferase subunit C
MLDRSQVLHVARLARLELTDDEIERMGGELSKVLDHIEKIRELDLSGVPPTTHVVDVAGVVRADQPRPCFPVEVALASAPEPVTVPIPNAPEGETGLGFGVPSPGQEPGE